jgi:hypothetical protein
MEEEEHAVASELAAEEGVDAGVSSRQGGVTVPATTAARQVTLPETARASPSRVGVLAGLEVVAGPAVVPGLVTTADRRGILLATARTPPSREGDPREIAPLGGLQVLRGQVRSGRGCSHGGRCAEGVCVSKKSGPLAALRSVLQPHERPCRSEVWVLAPVMRLLLLL